MRCQKIESIYLRILLSGVFCVRPHRASQKIISYNGIRDTLISCAVSVGLYPRPNKQSPGLFVTPLRWGRPVRVLTRQAKKLSPATGYVVGDNFLVPVVGLEPAKIAFWKNVLATFWLI